MRVLVVGNGGREHAIIKSLRQSKKVSEIYAARGNAGIAQDAKCIDISPMELEKICAFAKQNDIDLTVVAPDDPLAAGLVDMLEKEGLLAFGPNKAAAQIESSKVFSKNLMQKYNIPTAKYKSFDNYENALEYVQKVGAPLVIKADGLALGKGVIICQTIDEAKSALYDIMVKRAFGAAGESVVIEEFLTGDEVSVLTFCDGKNFKTMITACDHKRALDDDMGLNTGGMGAFSPCPFYTKEIESEVESKIIIPTVAAMAKEGRTFKGVLYFGLIKTADGMKVIEYNARFGDPETQVILPMLKTDLFDILLAVAKGNLSDLDIEWHSGAAVCVVLASGGYPKEYQKGKEITIGSLDSDITLYHSGTAQKNGQLVTYGGRVIGVCARAENVFAAREKVYKAIGGIHFEGMHYRTDIGKKFF